MITVFGLDPRSVVIAFLNAKLTGSEVALFDPARKFFFEEVADARTMEYDSAYSKFRETHGKVDFLEDDKLYEVISAEIFWALRYKSIDRGNLVMQVLGQIAAKGSKPYLAEETPEAKEMRFRVRKVLAEFNRALKFVGFRRRDDPAVSIATASFENDIADMVLRGEAMRNQKSSAFAVYDDQGIMVLFNGRIYHGRRQKVPVADERKGFKRFWSGLPESGKGILAEDELHTLKEFPRITPSQDREEGEPVRGDGARRTLDDFSN